MRFPAHSPVTGALTMEKEWLLSWNVRPNWLELTSIPSRAAGCDSRGSSSNALYDPISEFCLSLIKNGQCQFDLGTGHV